MKLTYEKALLFIEPKNFSMEPPIIDEITKSVASALENSKRKGVLMKDGQFIEDISTKGYHVCVCGAHSEASDYFLECGLVTNSLCIHYVAFHRDEIPKEELEKIDLLIHYEVKCARTRILMDFS